MAIIKDVRGREILDSRGNPTVEVRVELEGGIVATAGVPSGASTGAHEAIELRDGDEKRYGGKGVLKAVSHVNGALKECVVGMESSDQSGVDQAMRDLDGTENKSRLGANALLGISLATARAEAFERRIPLYKRIREISGQEAAESSFPIPMFNVLNGGMHSDSGLSVQEFKLVPKGIEKYAEQLRAGSEIFQTLKGILSKNGYTIGVGDEGGFAPRLESHAQAFEMLLSAIEKAGYESGTDVFLAVDVAANSFYDANDDVYMLQPENVRLNRDQLLNVYREWIEKYFLISIEDGLHEEDWDGWKEMQEKLIAKKDVMSIGDDLLVTNPKRLEKAIESRACNAVLIKPNQIGTLSETLETMRIAAEHHMNRVVSHRSGETGDDFIADLSVGAGAEYIKTGSLSRGERLAKYNRLLAIAEEMGR